MKEALLAPFYKWRNWDSVKLSIVSKVAQMESAGTGFEAQVGQPRLFPFYLGVEVNWTDPWNH